MNIDFTNGKADFLEDFYFETNFGVTFQFRLGIPTATTMEYGHADGSRTLKLVINGTGLTDDIFGKLASGTITSLEFRTNGRLQAEITDINWSVADYLAALDQVENQRKFDPFINFLSQDLTTIRALTSSEALLMDASGILGSLLSEGKNISGSGFDDRLFGGFTHNVIHGEDGNDTITGGASFDILHGDAGKDTIFGKGGEDLIEGGSATDILFGGGDNDTMFGSGGNDRMFGGGGFDTIDSGKGRDFVKGGKGDDEIKGGAGRDKLIGGEGRDGLQGGKGNDNLKGGAGRDLLEGGKGNDRLTGGADADRFEFSKGGGEDVITDYQIGIDGLGIRNALIDFKGLTNIQIIQEYAYVLNGDTVLDFGNNDTITLEGVVALSALANDITLF